jgi:hypothetical protein
VERAGDVADVHAARHARTAGARRRRSLDMDACLRSPSRRRESPGAWTWTARRQWRPFRQSVR